jgi:hypothetical protein
MYAQRQVNHMSSHQNEHMDDPTVERDGAQPALRNWWSELSGAAKILIPTTAVVLVFVTANALPSLVF